MEMEDEIEQKIRERKFNVFHWMGFSARPMLALKAGVCIGIAMQLDKSMAEKKRLLEIPK